MDKNFRVVRSEIGHLKIEPTPTDDELAQYYNEKYYTATDGRNQYAHGYTDDELLHKKIHALETIRLVPRPEAAHGHGTAFEVGVGEGFTLKELRDAGWQATGIDFTPDGLRAFNPEMEPFVTFGDAYALLDAAIAKGEAYDLVICNHVLEHVPDPADLLERMRRILKPGGVLRFVVPNDGSWLHDMVVESGDAPEHFFLAPPDHLHYFTREPLLKLIERTGYELIEMLGEFPIDLFLLHSGSNYVQDKSQGRSAHFARIRFENTLIERSVDEFIAFRRGCGAAGIGRSLVCYIRPRG